MLFKNWVGSWHSSLKHMNCWQKTVQSLICYSWIYSLCNCIFTSKSLNCCICWIIQVVSIKFAGYIVWIFHYKIQSLQFCLKSVPSLLKYRIFSRGLFFIHASCKLERNSKTKHNKTSKRYKIKLDMLREHKPPPNAAIRRIRISDFGLLDPKRDPDRHQNCITWSLSHALPLQKISSKSVHKFASNPTDRHTNRQTDKQTDKQTELKTYM